MTMQTNGTANGMTLERLFALGDIESLRPIERAQYLVKLCESLGLNPFTQPFALIKFQGKTIPYAKRDAADQLRKLHGVSVTIVSRERKDDLCIVTARATTPDGRTDESIGAVSLSGLKGENLANALMKAETKAKRRVTLSICGLGWLDETEVSDMKGAKPMRVTEQGDIVDASPEPPSAPDLTKQLAASVDLNSWVDGVLADIENAKSKGAVNEVIAQVQAEAKEMAAKGAPVSDSVRERIKEAALARKAALS